MDKTTVLIVEDEAIVAADLSGKLAQLGYEVVGTVASGEDAVELAFSMLPHVVLMDIWLKGTMDGIEAAETIRRRVDVPVIYLTAHSDAATLDRAKLSGPFGYVLKPFEERELATTIEMALYKHQSDRRLREQQEALRRSHDELERRVEERTGELRDANESVKAERQRLYDVLETLPVYVILLDSDYHVPFANRFFRERFGESHGKRCYEYLFDRSEPCKICETYTVMKTKAPHHWYWTGPDDRDYDIYDYPFADSDGSAMILEMGIDITDQRRAEEAVRLTSAYNRSLIEASLDPLVTIGHDGKITDVNSATEEATGRPRLELIGTDFCDYFSEPDKARAGYEQVFREGTVLDYPLELCHRDGHTTSVLYNASVYRDEQGKVIGVFAAARDITGLKKAQTALRELNETLEERIIERTAQLNAAHEKLRDSHRAALNLMEDAISARNEVEKANEELRREMAERKRAEEELSKTNQRLLALMQAVPVGVSFSDDATGQRVTGNPAALAQFEMGPDDNLSASAPDQDAPGRTVRFFRGETQVNDADLPLQRAVAENRVIPPMELEVLLPSGRRWFADASGAPVHDGQGNVVGGLAVTVDITERKLAEAELVRLNKALKALSDTSQAVIRAGNESAYLDGICRIILEECGYSMVWIGFAEDDEAKSVRPAAWAGFEDGYLESLRVTWADAERGRGPTGTAIRTGKVTACRNILTDPAFAPWREEAARRGYASSIVFPLLDNGKAFGAITIYSAEADPFTENEVMLLAELADNISYGIKVLRLRRAQQDAEEDLRRSGRRMDIMATTAGRLLASDSPQLVVNELCTKVMEFLDCHAFFNFLVENEEGRLRLNACGGIPEDEARRIEWLEYGTAVCGCAARDACRIVAEDIPNTPDPRTDLVKSYGIKAYACHPLMAQGRVLGTLSFGSRSRPRFTEDELSLMKAVADQVSIAMERKRVEEELRQAKEAAEAANRAKSQFLANMSHELRTPLTGLLGMLEIAGSGSLDEKQREAVDTAHMSGRSLLMIINDILDLTRIEAGKFVMEENPFTLRKTVMDSVNFLKPEAMRKGLDLDWTMADGIPETVIGDRMRLQQVLTNLLGNAVKFTKKGSVGITVTAGKKTPEGKTEFTFAVSDTGIGIADDKKRLIFEPFSQADPSHTRRFGGTGLGLTISRQIVELMGGTIALESTEGKGSTFTFSVPFWEADLESKDKEVKAAPPESAIPVNTNGTTTRLLIAEDDEVTRKVLDFMFRQYGFDLQFALNGYEAVDLWGKGNFDLIIMDGQMPEMDGFTATRAIRARELETGSRIPIIAITAHAFPEDEQRCLDAGMDAYIAKPIDFKKCVAMIRNMLGGSAAKG